jgi:hypothetical protein
MIKRLFAALFALVAAVAFAASVDANRAQRSPARYWTSARKALSKIGKT